ncbi:hypothetical protein STAQ_37760 [Allostella sp. ATCC 35155]|nr:hypothetical protein STAQ_37760 [Stella sp. ATCC 35155]
MKSSTGNTDARADGATTRFLLMLGAAGASLMLLAAVLLPAATGEASLPEPIAAAVERLFGLLGG